MNYYNKQLHDCIYNNNKPKQIVYKKQILLEKNLYIKEKTFIDYFREAEDKYYISKYRYNTRCCVKDSPTIMVLSIHLYRMMISELKSCYFLEHCTGDSQYYTIYYRPKMKYRGIQVEINYRNDDFEINLY
jgi:hypothetical protein